jgi:hypothetical protein
MTVLGSPFLMAQAGPAANRGSMAISNVLVVVPVNGVSM